MPYYSIENISKIDDYVCNKSDYTNSFSFDRDHTMRGLVIFKIMPHSQGKVDLEIFKNGEGIGSLVGYNKASMPNDLNKALKYKKYIQYTLKKLITDNYNDSSFAPNFSIRQTSAIRWIENLVGKKTDKKGSKYKRITRLEFMKLVSDIMNYESQNQSRVYMDVDTKNRKYANILDDLNIKFLDKYEKYFQPDKKIKRKEAAYILYNLYKYIK